MEKNIIFLMTAVLVATSGCDMVEPPKYGCIDPIADNYDPEADHDDGSCIYDPSLFKGCTDLTAANYDPQALVSNCHCIYDNVRKILVEDYTGHTCGNCPRAAEVLHELGCEWGDRVVPLAVHVGFFAIPEPPMYAADYRTSYGNDWNLNFGNSAAGLPNGLVNRTPDGGNYIRSYIAWAALAANMLAQPAEANLTLTNTYSEATRTVNVVVDMNILADLNNGPYKLNVVVSEDSIIDYQKDYDPNLADENVAEYTHMHMLRTSLTGSWGADVNSGANLASGANLTQSFSVVLDAAWVDHNCNIVAWLARDDNKSVIQAEYRPVIVE